MKKLNITFCSFPDFSGNAKALYEYMLNRYKNNMNYTWVMHDEKYVEQLKKENIRTVLIGTDEFYDYIKTTDVFFTTHANLCGDKASAKNSIYVELWHGIGPKPVGFLSNNLNEQDYGWYNYISERIDYMICPSEFWRCIFSSMFRINSLRVKPLGLPILDEIKNSNGIENLSKVLNLDVKKYKKIIMYMPTFKKGCGRNLESNYSKENILNFYDYNDKQLIDYLKKNNYLLIVKRHPSDEIIYNEFENDNIRNLTNEMLSKYMFNVNSILNAGDVLVTDYSSLGLEFSFLNKPVIYISTDVDEYKENRGIVLDDYNFWVENNVSNYTEFINLLDKILSSNKRKWVSKNRELFFSDLNDGGCDRICDFFFNKNKLNSNIVKYNSEIIYLEGKVENLEEKIKQNDIMISQLVEKIKNMEESKGWICLEKLRKVRGKFKNEK